ncbi:MAG: hypothetical protein RL240_3256 [Planctomycetota bacterium]|jgi:hypothetical protein
MPALRESKLGLAVPSVVWARFASTVFSLVGSRSRMPVFALSRWLFSPTTACVALPRRAGMHARSTGRGLGLAVPSADSCYELQLLR